MVDLCKVSKVIVIRVCPQLDLYDDLDLLVCSVFQYLKKFDWFLCGSKSGRKSNPNR